MHEFISHADAYIDLHGGDIPEDLVPFVISRAGDGAVDQKSKEMAMAFGLPYVLTVSKPVQVAKGLSSYAGAAENGVPAILAEGGGVGQLQEDAVEMLVNGVVRVMKQLGMMAADGGANAERRITEPKVLTAFEWVYSKHAGMWYSRVKAGDVLKKGQEMGTVGDLFGDTLETVIAPV